MEPESLFGEDGNFVGSSYTGLPSAAIKGAQNIARDARLAVLAGIIPILGLAFILRLVQWYLLASKYPDLVAANLQTDKTVRAQFQSALPRLWFAALFWPLILLALMVLIRLGRR